MKVKIFLAIWYFMKCHDTWYLKSNKLQWTLLKTAPFFFISLNKQLHWLRIYISLKIIYEMVFKSKNKHPQTDRQTNEPNLSSLKSRLVFQSLNCIKLEHVTFTTIKAILFTMQLNHDIAVYFSHIFFLRDFLNLLYIVLKNPKTNEDLYQFEPLNCGKLMRGLFSVVWAAVAWDLESEVWVSYSFSQRDVMSQSEGNGSRDAVFLSQEELSVWRLTRSEGHFKLSLGEADFFEDLRLPW